jgi:hypothetical protein
VIGDQEGSGLVARALDDGGLAFEDDWPRGLAEALAAMVEELHERDSPLVLENSVRAK